MSLSRSGRYRSKRKLQRKKRLTFAVVFTAVVAVVIVYMFARQPSQIQPQPSPSQSPQIQPPQTQPPQSPQTEPSTQPPDSPLSGDRRANAPEVTFSFVGDVMWASTIENVLKRNGSDYPYRKAKHLLTESDMTVANLESPLTERGRKQSKQYVYRSSPAVLPAFKEAGFDAVNLANNHILDYSVQGLSDTFHALDQAGIARFGAGRNADEAYRPFIAEKNGIRVALLGFSRIVPSKEWKAGKNPGVADAYDVKKAADAVAAAKKMSDLTVVVMHWGEERKDAPADYQKTLARQLVDAGADLIVGGHPHVLQGFERYKDRWIAYSLGNFVFTMNPNPKTWDSMILQASCSKTGDCSLKAVPILTKLADPEPMNEEDGRRLLRHLSAISVNASVSDEGAVKEKAGP